MAVMPDPTRWTAAVDLFTRVFDAHTTHRFTRLWQLYPLFGPLSVHLFALFPEEHPGWTRRRVLVPLYLTTLAVIAWRQLTLDDSDVSDRASLVSAILLSCSPVESNRAGTGVADVKYDVCPDSSMFWKNANSE